MTEPMHAGRRRAPSALRVLTAVAILASILTLITPGADRLDASAATGGQASRYVAISPERVLDTRYPGFGVTRDGDGDTLSLDPLTPAVIAAAGVDPLAVKAVAINLTITEPIAPSWLKSFPFGLATSDDVSTSAVNNRIANETIANFSIVPVGTNGRISIQSLRSSHIVVDVQGVFEGSTSSRAGRFVPLDVPTRITDTRQTRVPVPANGQLVIDLSSVVDEGASAALINMVATETQGSGFLTVHPGGKVPNSSNLNYTGVAHTIAGSAIARLRPDGTTTISVSNNATHIVVDVIGWMTGEMTGDSETTSSSSGLYVPVSPERHYDSRPEEVPIGSSALAPRTSRSLQIAGKLSVPATGVLGVATNLTMTNTDGPGYLVMYPKEPMPDPYSSVNSMFANHSIANHAIARLHNGKLSVYSMGRSDFIVDVSGYFLDGTTTPPRTTKRQPTTPPTAPSTPTGVTQPPADNDYEYLLEATGSNAQYGAYQRNGRKYYGWTPCGPITYAVNTERATQSQINALNTAIENAEQASGFDFIYRGNVTGSLKTNGVDSRVAGSTESAMAVFAFSDPYATPILAGNTIGIGGIGPSAQGALPIELAGGSSTAWVVRGGFAIIDITDISSPAEITSAFTHEIAHMLGLDHVNAIGELMRPVILSPPQENFGNGDKNGLYSIGAPQCSTNARLTTNAPLAEPIGIDVSIASE